MSIQKNEQTRPSMRVEGTKEQVDDFMKELDTSPFLKEIKPNEFYLRFEGKIDYDHIVKLLDSHGLILKLYEAEMRKG